MVPTRLKSVYCITKIGQRRSGFSFKDYCFDNLGNTIFQFCWITCELALFFGNPVVELLVYSDFHNKKRWCSGQPVCLACCRWYGKSSPGPVSHTCRSLNWWLWWLLHRWNEVSIAWQKNRLFQSTHEDLSSISHSGSYYFNWTQYIKWDHFEMLATGRLDIHCRIKD